jgi:hypothetical protein
MKITLEPTTQTHTIDGVAVRLWQGTTDQGTPIFAFITRVGVDRQTPCPEIEAALREASAPRPELTVFPARLVL